MWLALVPLTLALIALVVGGRATWKDFEEQRWGWAALGVVTTLAGTTALALFAHAYAATVAGL